MGRREDIAGAVSVTVAVNGESVTIDGKPWQPATMSAWQSWPVWTSTVWLTRCVSQWSWNVFLVLPPGDPAAWSEAEADIIEPVRDGLESIGHIERVEPVVISADNLQNAIPALQFTLVSA